jgi:hypothetical protein
MFSTRVADRRRTKCYAVDHASRHPESSPTIVSKSAFSHLAAHVQVDALVVRPGVVKAGIAELVMKMLEGSGISAHPSTISASRSQLVERRTHRWRHGLGTKRNNANTVLGRRQPASTPEAHCSHDDA